MRKDETGKLVEIESDLTKAIERVVVTEKETILRRKQLEEAPKLLEVRDLKVWFPTQLDFFGKPKDYIKAVNNVNFKMKEGETLGLVGESGCGKTTLGKTILRLNPAYDGEINYKGRNILDLSKSDLKELRKEMQIIFQDP